MKNLKITPRLSVSILFLLLSLAFLFNAYIKAISANIVSTRLELEGTAYLRPLVGVLDKIVENYGLKLRVEGGEESAAVRLKASTAETTKAFDQFKAAYERTGPALGFDEASLKKHQRTQLEFSALQAQWQALATADPTSNQSARYAQLVRTFRIMMSYVGDSSALILDPDLDSYYLMHPLVKILPNTMDDISQAEYVIAMADKKALADEHGKASAVAAMLEDIDLDRVDTDLQISYNEDQNYYGVSQTLASRTKKELAEFDAAAHALASSLRSLTTGASETSPRYLVAESARKSTYALWSTIVIELDSLLKTRLEHFESERNTALVKSLIALAIAIGFFWYVTHGIIVALKRLEKAMGEIAGGKLDCEVPGQDMKDEIGSMARTLEMFRKSYWWLDTR
jgi:HAMP domain-containing protein